MTRAEWLAMARRWKRIARGWQAQGNGYWAAHARAEARECEVAAATRIADADRALAAARGDH